MTELVEFLTARYNEAEKHERGRYTTTIWPADHRCAECAAPVEDIHFRASGGDAEEITLEPCGHTLTHAAYLDRYCESAADPFVLADIDAKRKMLADILAETHTVNDGDCWYTCPSAIGERDGGECCDDDRRGLACDCGRDAQVDRRLRILVSPYAGHLDYEKAVRP